MQTHCCHCDRKLDVLDVLNVTNQVIDLKSGQTILPEGNLCLECYVLLRQRPYRQSATPAL